MLVEQERNEAPPFKDAILFVNCELVISTSTSFKIIEPPSKIAVLFSNVQFYITAFFLKEDAGSPSEYIADPLSDSKLMNCEFWIIRLEE